MGRDRANELNAQISDLLRNTLDGANLTQSFASFDAAWAMLTLRELGRVLQLLIERIDYDGVRGKIAIALNPLRLKSLSETLSAHQPTSI